MTPAALRFPEAAVLATSPDVPGHRTDFELLVDERGAVERVRLLSEGNQLRDKMLMAAAKAWRFTPATRHGRPVRYRMTISVQQ